MMKGLFSRKKTKPFKEYYAEWHDCLKSDLVPLLRRSMASSTFCPFLLSSHVELLHAHFQSLYSSLDLAASHDVAQILYPDWRNSLEKPFLWLGDFHPQLFSNLLRSFLEDRDEEQEAGRCIAKLEFTLDRPWSIAMAWKNPGKALMSGIQQIECGLRLIVPSLVVRARDAQARVVDKVACEWVKGSEEATEGMGKATVEAMEELTCVVLDANRLRRSVLSEILAALDAYQAALFLEGLAEFVTGFRDSELLGEFERTKLPLGSWIG
ncbi:hypothetical protein Droror1_Dr00027640 [Drosera rotundifolia]